MEIFTTLFIILLVATAIYYVVFFSLIYYWHEAKLSYLILPVIYTFEFFIVGFLIISIISILVYYFPELLKLWQ
jgi:ABC-type multidrug transport system permease subunit